MELSQMLAMVDHTLLKPESTWAQIKAICDDAMKYHTATVCIPACYVARCKAYMQDRADKVGVCTVIGFPTGYSTTEAKVFEAADAVKNGADEVDMVINIGMLKDGRDDEVLAEINAIKAACAGHTLKVIIETCLLTEEEKIRMCDIVSKSDADFIKTSTGFSTAGATFDDVALMKAHMKPGKGIKAAGGIASLDDAYKLHRAGRDAAGHEPHRQAGQKRRSDGVLTASSAGAVARLCPILGRIWKLRRIARVSRNSDVLPELRRKARRGSARFLQAI